MGVCHSALADDERAKAVVSSYRSHVVTDNGLPSGAVESLRHFIREHPLSTKPKLPSRTQQQSSHQQTAIHLLPFVTRPGIFPQGFFRIANIGTSNETIEILLADDEGNVEWQVELDTSGGETRHVNSDDLAGWTTKAGIRTSYFGRSLSDRKTYTAIMETSRDIYIRAFTRSSDGFINDVGTTKSPFRNSSNLWATILGTANPGSNQSVVGVLRYINFDTDRNNASVDIWGYDDNGSRSGIATCSIPKLGTLSVDVIDLELGTHPSCTGSWGDGVGKWEVHSASDSGHMAMSFLLSVQLGILANISTAEIFRTQN